MTQYQDARMGEFYQDKPILNLNTVLNYFLAKPTQLKFKMSAMATLEVQFPDVSFYQDEISYSAMRLNTDTIILRIGQNLWKDDQFERNYLEAKKQGMKVGGYWFYDDRISPRTQAELLVEWCLGKKFELEIFIDWERSYGGEFSGLKNVVAMMQLLDQAISMRALDAKGIGFYTGYYWFRSNSNPSTNAGQYNYLKNKPLWLAWYTNNVANVLIPAPWNNLTLWQWGTPIWNWGQKTKEIDMNWFNGTKQEFETRYGNIGEPTMSYIEIKSLTGSNHTIRQPTAYPQEPHILGGYLATLEAGATHWAEPNDYYVYASDIFVNGVKRAAAGDKWWKLSVIGTVGWIAERHLGVNYVSATLVNTPEDPVLPTLTISISDTEGKYNPVTVTLTPK